MNQTISTVEAESIAQLQQQLSLADEQAVLASPLRRTRPRLYYQVLRDCAPVSGHPAVHGRALQTALWMAPIVSLQPIAARLGEVLSDKQHRIAFERQLSFAAAIAFRPLNGPRALAYLPSVHAVTALSATAVRGLLEHISGQSAERPLPFRQPDDVDVPGVPQLRFVIGSMSRAGASPNPPEAAAALPFSERLRGTLQMLLGEPVPIQVGVPQPFGAALLDGLRMWANALIRTDDITRGHLLWDDLEAGCLVQQLLIATDEQQPLTLSIKLPMCLLGEDGFQDALSSFQGLRPSVSALTGAGGMLS